MKQDMPNRKDLRNWAEKELKSGEDPLECNDVDMRRLIHELQVHQYELEIQNEELRRAQAGLEESRSHYADLYDFAPVGYVTFDREGIIVEANVTIANQLGTERAIVLKKPFFSYLPKSDRDVFRLHLTEVFKTGKRQICEVKLNSWKPEGFFARLDSMFVVDASGKRLVRTSVSDITSFKHAEEVLARSHRELEDLVVERTTELSTANEQLRREMEKRRQVLRALAESRAQIVAVVDSTNDFIWSVDPENFGLITWNTACGDYFLKSRGIELHVGMTPEQLVPLELVSRWNELFSRALREEHFSTEYVVEKETIILLLSFNLLKRDGVVFGISIFGKDITERKNAEEAIKANEAKFRSYIEAAPLAVFVADREGRLLDFNPAGTDLLGYDVPTLRNMHVMDLHPEDDREEVLRDLAALLETGRVETQIRMKRRDGQIIWVSLHVVMISDRLSLGYCQDITVRKQADEVLRQREKELMTLTGRLISTQEEELRRLSRELHDDLTQRLAVLAMDAGMIEKQLGPIKTQASEETRDLKDKLIEISEVVHDLSRQLHPSILDDLGLVQAVESECALFTKRNGITLSFANSDVPDAIPNDIALCLYRAIQEGIRNIAAHSKTNAARITLQGFDGGVVLKIQDLGVGFNVREARAKLGIGLAGMRERVRLVKGTMFVRSEPGKGTEIEISIPLGGKHGRTAHTDCR